MAGDSEEMVRLLVHLVLHLREQERACLERLSLTHAQARALWAIRSDDVLGVRMLAERVDSDPSNVSTTVGELEERGLVERTSAAHDRRLRALRLTPVGRALRRRLVGCLEPAAVTALDPKDRDRLLELLRQLESARAR